MDDIVLRAIAKWPNVPAVYGWLRLDRRGNWLIRDERVANPVITAFIGRNYAHDDEGRWFFQNGPQRVFVTLDYTPFVYRTADSDHVPPGFEAHDGRMINRVQGVWLDESGALLLATELGIGVLHDGDLARLVPYFVDGRGTSLPEDEIAEHMALMQEGRSAPLRLRLCDIVLRIEPIRSGEVPQRFGFVQRPVQPAAREVGGRSARSIT